MNYIWAFIVGGIICVVGQILLDLTNLTPARILVIFVVSGVVLSGLGLWQPLVEIAGAGATVPIIGFGHLLAEGVKSAVAHQGLVGVFTGGLSSCSGGVSASLVFGFLASVVTRSKSQS